MDYFIDGQFTFDWTSHHVKRWEEFLRDKAKTATDVLEVGSFEGRSALFFLQFLPKARITCVDYFRGQHRACHARIGLCLEYDRRRDPL